MSNDSLAESLFSKVVDLEQANLALKSTNANLLTALQDLTLNVNEAMKTGGWVPTPLHSSFWEAMSNSFEAIRQATGEQQ